MSLFEEISNADEQGRGQKIMEPALNETLSYKVKVLNHSLFQSKRKLGDVFVVEFELIEESGKDLGPGGTKARKGGRYSWTQFPSGQWGETAKGHIKAYIRALLSLNEDPTAQMVRDVVDNKHTGIFLDLEVTHILTEKSQRDYFVHTWRPGTQAPASVPDLPAISELAKESWLAGEGEGTEHPQNPAYEYREDHPEWGVREVR